ncbi:MAG: hypothetical protein MJ097_00675 [Dorea sp.]|nr:hypothetical protein [Dorea sp.]
MLDLNEIDHEIEKLEKENMTYRTCEKLSVLYAVRSNNKPIQGAKEIGEYSYASSGKAPESLFLKAAAGKNMDEVLGIIDEHLNAVQVLYPKEYDLVIRKIREL